MRSLAERAARGLALLLILWAAWLALQPAAPAKPHRAALSRVATELPAWTREGSTLRAHVTADSFGNAEARDWLRALRRAGAAVAWHPDSSLHPVALAVDPVAEPAGGVLASVVAPAGVALRDRGMLLDSLAPSPAVQGIRLAATAGAISAGIASAAPGDSLLLRPVLVVGRASWEARFVIAALEESGWTVEKRLRVAPRMAVESPQAAALDTTHFSAVVLLDSAAAPEAAAVARFVAQGGGAVIAGSALDLGPLASLLPGRAGPRIRPSLVAAAATPVTAASGGYRPLALARDAVPLERQGPAITVAARRAGEGRILAVGYDESWRWRMQGDEQAPAAHRRWWSRAVGSVARPALVPRNAAHADPAPMAALHDALGAPSQEGPNERTLGRGAAPDPRVLLGAILLLLLAEWGSRRLRGER